MVVKLEKPNFAPIADELESSAENAAAPIVHNVHKLQAALKTAVERRTGGEAEQFAAQPEPDTSPRKLLPKTKFWRLAKTAVAISLVVVVGWEPLRTLLQPASVEAVVNARLVTLKSPIA